jgi:hypothetical protein
MIDLEPMRDLFVLSSSGAGESLSAASALVHHGTALYVVADDQPYIARFDAGSESPGSKQPLFDEEWPVEQRALKATKADLEALAAFAPSPFFPRGALFAMGSGSKPNRQRGVVLAFDAAGKVDVPRVVDLRTLFDPLNAKLQRLNVEGAFVCGEYFVLLHRGNKGDKRNAAIRYGLKEFCDALAGGQDFSAVHPELFFYDLGLVAGVPLAFTDGAALDDRSFVFTAVAEDTADSYNDGRCLGSALGVADLEGRVLRMEALRDACKVEGVALGADGDLLLVTDADAPHIPARLLRASLSVLGL